MRGELPGHDVLVAQVGDFHHLDHLAQLLGDLFDDLGLVGVEDEVMRDWFGVSLRPTARLAMLKPRRRKHARRRG